MNCENCGGPLGRRPDKRYKHSFCGVICRNQWQRSSGDRIGEKNPSWKGTAATESAGRRRAQSWFSSKPCAVCGSGKSERHHKDRNPLNNLPDNIEFLCRKHHMEADGRLEALMLYRIQVQSAPDEEKEN